MPFPTGCASSLSMQDTAAAAFAAFSEGKPFLDRDDLKCATTALFGFRPTKREVELLLGGRAGIERDEFINLTTAMVISGCTRRTLNRTGAAARISCKGTRNFNTARERWWFVAVSNCNSTKGLRLR